jgi:hypothetical protein
MGKKAIDWRAAITVAAIRKSVEGGAVSPPH